ncbi:MAG: hypothetical protein AUJ75_02115 [Candidatus Omnitrophica bacterium CG1_02_49_10]|nr:MAG: hypothetical protein AUJ75_02115 [Candidatus Omnitrophica bacterium CG1_02_49_10]
MTLNYFENQFGVSVSRVYVTGGGCAIDGLRASIKESAAADVIYWDPLTGVEIDEKIDKEALAGIKDRLAVSLGLCMIR